MTTLSPTQFLEIIHRDGVDFKIETKYHRANCRHESAVPTHYAKVMYTLEQVGEIYRWQGEKWMLTNFGFLEDYEEID